MSSMSQNGQALEQHIPSGNKGCQSVRINSNRRESSVPSPVSLQPNPSVSSSTSKVGAVTVGNHEENPKAEPKYKKRRSKAEMAQMQEKIKRVFAEGYDHHSLPLILHERRDVIANQLMEISLNGSFDIFQQEKSIIPWGASLAKQTRIPEVKFMEIRKIQSGWLLCEAHISEIRKKVGLDD